jgi:hypothetical protein
VYFFVGQRRMLRVFVRCPLPILPARLGQEAIDDVAKSFFRDFTMDLDGFFKGALLGHRQILLSCLLKRAGKIIMTRIESGLKTKKYVVVVVGYESD